MSTSRNLGLRALGVNAGRTLVANVLTIALGLGLSVLLARGLGPEANGIYALAILLPMTLSTFLNLGIGPANVYHVGRRDLTPRQAMRASLRAWAVLAGLGVIITPIVLSIWGDAWFPGVPTAVMMLAVVSFPMTLLHAYLVSLLQGVQDFKRYNGLTIITPAITLVLSVLFILVLRIGVVGAVIAYTTGQAVSLGIAWYLLRPHLAAREDEAAPAETVRSALRRSLSYGWKAHLSNIIAFLNYRIDVFIVNLLMNPASVGVYWVAVQMAERMWLISGVVSVVLLPRLAELHTDEEKRLAITPIVTRFVLVVTGLACVALALLARPLISLLFGSEFASAQWALLILLPGVLAGSLSKVLGNEFAARGRPDINSVISGIVVVINVIANVLLIPRLGINGGALSSTIAYTMNAVLQLAVYRRFSGRPWYHLVVPTRDDALLVREGWRAVRSKLGGRRPGAS